MVEFSFVPPKDTIFYNLYARLERFRNTLFPIICSLESSESKIDKAIIFIRDYILQTPEELKALKRLLLTEKRHQITEINEWLINELHNRCNLEQDAINSLLDSDQGVDTAQVMREVIESFIIWDQNDESDDENDDDEDC